MTFPTGRPLQPPILSHAVVARPLARVIKRRKHRAIPAVDAWQPDPNAPEPLTVYQFGALMQQMGRAALPPAYVHAIAGVLDGRSNPEIARRRDLSTKTVSVYLSRSMDILQTNSRYQTVMRYMRGI